MQSLEHGSSLPWFRCVMLPRIAMTGTSGCSSSRSLVTSADFVSATRCFNPLCCVQWCTVRSARGALRLRTRSTEEVAFWRAERPSACSHIFHLPCVRSRLTHFHKSLCFKNPAFRTPNWYPQSRDMPRLPYYSYYSILCAYWLCTT